jgi:predicted RNA methylase
MSSYHECAREPPSCRGLKQGIRGYHACAKKKNCRKVDRPIRKLQTKLKSVINPISLKAVKLKKKAAPKPKAPTQTPKAPTQTPKAPTQTPKAPTQTPKPSQTPKPPPMEGAPTTIFKVPLNKLISVTGDILNVYYPEHKIKSTEKQNLQLWKATKKKYNIATITGFKSDVLKIINDTTMPKLFNTNITNMLTRKYQDDFNDQFNKKFKKLSNKLLWYMFTNSIDERPEPEPELEPVPKPDQDLYKTPPKNKCFDALDLVKTQYTTGFKNIKFEDKIKQTPAYKLYKEMSDVIQGSDFYPTPEKYGKFIYEDATKFNRNSILDIAAGYGNLSYEWIKDTQKKVGIVERNSTFAKLFKCFENQNPGHLKLYNTDYLKMDTPNIDYDVIVCNPPFSKTAFAGKRTDYTFWLLKAMYDGWKMGTKEIYFICPVTILDNPTGYGNKSKIDVLDVKNPQVVTDLKISKTVYKLFTDNFKDWDGILDYDEDNKEYNINYGQIQLMGSISGFQTLGKNNKLKTLNINVVMLKIISFTDKPDTKPPSLKSPSPAITSPAITSQPKPPSLKVTSQPKPPSLKSKNPWLIHVAKIKVENPNIQYKNVLKLAKTTYTKTA